MQLLRDLIIEEISKKGKIAFAEFMQMALYHPKYGYYNSDKERVGRGGDYYTSPTVHGIFGELIAKQLEEMWRFVRNGTFTVVETGAGKGWLCHDIVLCVMHEYPELYDNLHYIIVESNPYAKEEQRALLKSGGIPDDKVSWHTYTNDGFSFGSLQGCFLSNEFADALPVHRLEVKKGILKEVYVGYNGNEFYEIKDEVSSGSLKRHYENYQPYLGEGSKYEVNLEIAEWLRHVSVTLQKGFVIIIDYGDTINKLARLADGNGTVRCFHKHTVSENYYKQPGEQDITADVDFTYMMDNGRLFGLEVTGFTRQSHFLIALGVLDKLNMHNDIEMILKAKTLLHPEGMGDIFKVLIQHKNLEHPQLTGLRPLHTLTMQNDNTTTYLRERC